MPRLCPFSLRHAGSPFREGLPAGSPCSRYVLFSLLADELSIGVTLTGLRNRNYTSPSGKWTEEMRSALAPELRPMLDWELPDDSDGQDIRGVARL